MGYRMSLGCSCDGRHYALELDQNFAATIWSDDFGILAGQGVATLRDLAGEGDEEAEDVSLDAAEFSAWLDALAANREAILSAVSAGGGHPHKWQAWQAAAFESALREYRELAQHCAELGATVEAGWA